MATTRRNRFSATPVARALCFCLLLPGFASCGEGAIEQEPSYNEEAIRRHCGNGVCSVWENCSTCPRDCGRCPPDDRSSPRLDASVPPPDSGCVSTTCAAQGKNCGTISNGCGGTLACGNCTAPQTCGGGGTQNVCGSQAPVALLADDFESLPTGFWSPGSVHGNWSGVFSANDSIGIATDGSHVLTQASKVATSPGETYSTGVYTMKSLGDLDLSLRLKTVAQLRTGSTPNPWEVGWIFWHYTDRLHFYWVVLKPNGWELGKVAEGAGCPWGNQCQIFLQHDTSPSFPTGRWYNIRIRQVGGDISVWVDGTLLTTYSDPSPYLTGTLGLYEEDARAQFDDVRIVVP